MVSPLLLCLLAVSGRAVALAPPQPPDPQLPPQSAAISGKEFGAVRLPLVAVQGDIAFKAQSARTWQEGSEPATRRLILENDVRIRLGDYEFKAKRAVVWLQKVAQKGDAQTYQVYAILDDVNTTAGSSGTFENTRLPVKGLLTAANVKLNVDRLVQGREDSPFLTECESQCADAIRLISGVPTRDQIAQQLARAQEAKLLAERAPAPPPQRTASLPPLPREHAALPPPQLQTSPTPAQTAAADTTAKQTPPPAPQTQTPRPVTQRRYDETRQPKPPAPATDAMTQPPVAQAPTQKQPYGQPSSPASNPPTQPAAQAQVPPAAPAAATTPSQTSAPASAPVSTTTAATQPPNSSGDAIFNRTGSVSISAKDITLQGGKDENAIMASGGVNVQYIDATSDRTLEMAAQRAVIFLDPSPLAQTGRVGADHVRGIYLEGAVSISDGKNHLTGQKVFYDLQKNRGMVLDSTYWTYDKTRSLPLYVRADAIRQESQDTFKAENATLSTTAFFDPDLSLGVRSVTISKREPTATVEQPSSPGFFDGLPGGLAGDSPSGVMAAAEGITLRAYGLPFMYVPSFTGDPGNMPIRDVRIENSNAAGLATKVRWNLYGLLGRTRPDNFNAELFTDFYLDRGPALGTNLTWTGKESQGSFFAYGLLDDRGTDVLKPGTKIDRDGGFRGMIEADNRWKLDEHWTLFTEATYIGDEAFVDAFFERQGEVRREFTTQMLAVRREENTQLTLQAKGTLNDFIANEYLLQSSGYKVNKLPEATYTRLNDDLLADKSPGLLGWTHEYRVGVLSMDFDKPFAYERGFANNTLAQRTFGINGNQTIADRLRAQGLFESNVMRADTRQEFTSQLSAGPVMVTPFVVGRATSYSKSFDQFSPQDTEKSRFWGAAGTRVSTTLQRVDDSVQSRFFDLSRIRHIIEPGVTLWSAGSNRDSSTLPVYDDAVESLAQGTQTRIGVHQTWQTQRGKAGSTRSVDVVRLDTDYVVASADANRDSPIRRFYDARPELSEVGKFFVTDFAWQATDALALTANNIYDFEIHQSARTSTGFLLEQGQDFATFVELRHINSQNSQFLDLGGTYKVNSKYRVGALTAYALKDHTFQTVTFNLQRQSESVLFGFDISYNSVTGETGFGFLFRPMGTGGSGGGSRSLGGLPNAAYGR